MYDRDDKTWGMLSHVTYEMIDAVNKKKGSN